jgi:hypothetical protein
MRLIIWTHGFDTNIPLQTIQSNINIYTLENFGQLLWSDMVEEAKYRRKIFDDVIIDEIDEFLKKNLILNTGPTEMIFSFFNSFKTLEAGETMRHFICYACQNGEFKELYTPGAITLSEILAEISREYPAEIIEVYCYACRQNYQDFIADYYASGRDINRLRISQNTKEILTQTTLHK